MRLAGATIRSVFSGTASHRSLHLVLYGPSEQNVLEVENVDLNITLIKEEEEPPPSFGDLPLTMPLAPPAPTN